MQSHSEAKIDNWLFKQKVNYVYEPVFWLDEKRIVPDWLSCQHQNSVLNKASLLNTGVGLLSQPNETGFWLGKRCFPKISETKKMKETAYLEMEDYYYIGLSPDDCVDLDYWLPTLLNQALGFQAFQTEDESNDDYLKLENDSSSAQNQQGQSTIQWKRIHQVRYLRFLVSNDFQK